MRFVVALSGIAVAGFAVRVVYVLSFSSHLHFGLDTVWYQLVGGTIASGDGYVDPSKFYKSGVAVATAFRPPLYPFFLAGVIKVFGESRRTFQLAGCGVGALTVGLVGLLGRRVAGETVGLCAAALAAVSPALIGFDASVMSETIYVPLVIAALLAVYAAIDRPTAVRWLLVGVIIGACMLTRGDALLFLPLLVVPAAVLVRRSGARRAMALAGAAIVGAAVVVAPWVVRNNERVGQPTIATLHVGTAVAGTNCRSTYYGPKLGSWEAFCADTTNHPELDEVKLSNRLVRQGLHYARTHAARLPVVVPVRVLRLAGVWDPAGEVRLESIESRNVAWQVVTLGAFLPTAVLAGYGIVLLRRRTTRVIPLASVLASVILAAILTYGEQRLRAAAEPVLLVAASVALVNLGSRWRSRRTMVPARLPATPPVRVN